MASFSLSPGVVTREFNLTGYVPNIASAKTGVILRANQGPALDVTPIASETELVNVFGKPTSSNFQDWFQAWNFLQYSSSLYVVRPIDANASVMNAGVEVYDYGASKIAYDNFYNNIVAQNSLRLLSKTAPLVFINKEVTSNQRLAVSVSSNPDSFKKQIGLEYYAIANTVNGTNTVTSTQSAPTLINGSQVILNGDKLATVTSITQSSVSGGTIVFDRPVSGIDVDPFYATAGVSAVTSVGTEFVGKFAKAGFTFKVGTKLNDFVVTKIANATTNNTLYDVTFTNVVSASVAPTFTEGQAYSSQTVYFTGKTAYNTVSEFGVKAGSTSIVLQPGFILEAGLSITVGSYTGVIASVDNSTNTIFLTTPVTGDIATVAGGITITVNDSTTIDRLILGVNFFDKVYDSSLIKKTRKLVTKPDGTTATIIAQSLMPFNAFFDYTPNWTNDEFVVVVSRKNDDGYYEKAEAHLVSYNPLAKNNNGANIFVENIFNKASKYLYAKVTNNDLVRPSTSNLPMIKLENTLQNGNTLGTVYPTKKSAGVGGGYDEDFYYADGYTKGDIMAAYTLFSDPEQFDVNIIMAHELDLNYASTIAESRRDCIAIVAPYDSTYLAVNTASDCTEYLLDNFGSQTQFDEKIFTTFGTYTSVYGNMKYQYDKFNNVNRWINVAGDIAGLYAQTDSKNDPWFAPAGASRGVIKNAIKLAFNPNKQSRDDLYVNAINPIMAIPGEGNAVVFGQKTATSIPSAMDRVNVRRLLIHLERSISIAVNVGLFEFNDKFTRTRLFNIIDPFLRSVKSRRGLYSYKIICDESNNTPDVIDQNGLIIDVYLQATKVAEFIKVNVAAVPTGATFTEYVGQF